MRNYSILLAIFFFCCLNSNLLFANTTPTKDPIVSENKAKTTADTNGKTAKTAVNTKTKPTYKNYPDPTYPPTDSLRTYVDSTQNKYPPQLKGHYLTRQPFNNSVSPSYNIKSRYSGLNQTEMDVPKL